MKRYQFKYMFLICIFICSISFSACTTKSTAPAYNPNSHITATPTVDSAKDNLKTPNTNSTQIIVSPSPALPKNEVDIYVKEQTIYLGESTTSLIQKLGSPTRIDSSEYDFDYYIYNNDYSRLAFIAVKDDKVVGLYTDSLDFDFQGISAGSSFKTVNKVLHNNFSLDQVLTTYTDRYTINVLMDTIDSQKVTGIYILPANTTQAQYTVDIMKCLEQRVFDLTNSVRARNNIPLLSWSSSAALAARKHSTDMADNGYLDHTSLLGGTLKDRLSAEGIYYTNCDENIIAGYESAVLATHRLFNSTNNRQKILNEMYQNAGAGFAYQSDSTNKTYLTEVFYR